MITVERYGPAFKGEQPRDFCATVETIDNYVNRGGVVHFKGAKSGLTPCGSSIGARISKWSIVTCIACFRYRKQVRAVIDKNLR